MKAVTGAIGAAVFGSGGGDEQHEQHEQHEQRDGQGEQAAAAPPPSLNASDSDAGRFEVVTQSAMENTSTASSDWTAADVGNPPASNTSDSQAEPSAETSSLLEIDSEQSNSPSTTGEFGHHDSSSGEGDGSAQSIDASPLRSGLKVAHPIAGGAAGMLSPIPNVNETHDAHDIPSPSLDDESETTSMIMDSSEGREPGDLTGRIPSEEASWVAQALQAQQGSPTPVFGSFRAEDIPEAIFHGSGGGLDDDDDADVLGRGEEEEADVEEADAKRRAEEEAAHSPAAEEVGEEEVAAAGTNEEVDSPPAEQKRAASAPTIAAAAAATPPTRTQIDQDKDDTEHALFLSKREAEREEAERKAMEAQYEENLQNALLASTQEETADNDGEFPDPDDDDEIQEEAGEEERVGAAGANEEVDGPPSEANDTTAANDSSASDTSTWQPTESALESASTQPWSEGKKFASIQGKKIRAIRMELSKPLLDEGKIGIDACNIKVQLEPRGDFVMIARRKGDGGSRPVELLLEKGYKTILMKAAKDAYQGLRKNHELSGGATGDRVLAANPHDIQMIDDVWVAFFAFCFADAIFK